MKLDLNNIKMLYEEENSNSYITVIPFMDLADWPTAFSDHYFLSNT